ncbi:MAG: hypothetical protein NTW38_05235 [Candidatus Aminicenantes bacterium]|nr:hypothetical protein [Candidatus Aminicenantes bacterium]
MISNFDSQPPNTLGGNAGAFYRAPSSALVDFQTTADGRRALVLSATKESDGYCGAWIHLFETNGEPETREYLNVESFSRLVFWIRGDVAGPKAVVKIADSAWFRRDDALLVGPISSYVPSHRIETAWQLASIPLSKLPPNLDRRALANLVIEVTSPGAHRIEIKGLALVGDGSAPPLTPPKPRPYSRATWVWNTEQILGSPEERDALLAHLGREGIDLVYLNLPYISGAIAIDDAEMGEILASLHQRGIKAQALFGDKELVLPQNHAFVKNTIKDVIAYNSRVALPARFSGVHVDIEPYLLRGFNGRQQGEFLNNYVLILSEAAELAHSAGLEFGADIPSWFDMINEYSEDVLTAALRGRTKPVYEHIIDVCDQVTLMDYRTSASGVNGVIALAVGELAYAAKRGKKVYVGLETGPIEDERIFTFRGSPMAGFESFPKAPYFACVSGAGNELTITIVEAAKAAAFQKGLRDEKPVGRVEYWWPVYSASFLPGTSISFAALGREPLVHAADQASSELSIYPSFAGIAVHDYVNHRKLAAIR